MTLTIKYRDTVRDRICRDSEFTAALFAEAITALVEGEKADTLSILRDLVPAHITFKKLSEVTGFGEKAIHRMLGVNGNPTSENLAQIMRAVENGLGLDIKVTAQKSKSPAKRKKAPVYV